MSKEKKDTASSLLSSWKKKKGKRKDYKKKEKFSDGLTVRVWVFAVDAWVQLWLGNWVPVSCTTWHSQKPKQKQMQVASEDL